MHYVLGSSVQAADTGITTVFDKNGLKADFKVDSQWTGFFNGTITVTNTGTQPVEDWALTFDFPHEIANIWNAAIIEHQPGVYTVKNLVWNQDIPVGGSINFGFTAAATGEITRPTFFTVNTKTTEVAAERIKVEYVLYSDWGSGYSAALKITNLSATTIEDWTINFDFTRSISNLSCAKILAHNGTRYTLQNDGYTQNLSAGQTIQLGLGGIGGVAADVPANYILKQIVPAFDLVSDTDGDLVLDWIEICVNGTDPLVPGGATPTPTPTEVTPTPTEPVPTSTEPTPTTVEPSPTPTEPTPTPTPTPPVDMETDTDGDMIPDYYEGLLRTDKNNPDTDEDGFFDYIEVIYGLDPLTDDSNGDLDEDGLTNGEELDLGTCAWASDSDSDGLSDYEEVRIYGTDPMNPDSDADGLTDGDEAVLGKNPNDSSDADVKLEQTVTQDIMNAEDAGVQQVSVTASLSGFIDKSISVRDVYKVDYYTTDVYGRIGSPVSFESTEEFDDATITFSYDENALGDAEEENLGVLWYDEANEGYILQDQAIVDTEANTITLTVNHFSTYLVVNKDLWNNPVFPDTSNKMYIAHFTGLSYVMNWYPIDSIDKEFVELDHYAWWHLDQPGSKVATLYKNIEYSYNNGYEYVYNCTYDWLMADQTDTDKDGLFDWLETKGIMATNGKVYYSSPDSYDGDTDGISDLIELGAIYKIARLLDGTIYLYLDGACIYTSNDGTIPYMSKYSIFKPFFNSLAPGSAKYVCIPISDPNKPDTDGDGLLDGKALYTSTGKMVGPIDPDPREPNGPIGIWLAQLEQEENSSIPSELVGWYGYDVDSEDSFNLAEIDWSSLDISKSESVYAFFKKYCGSSDLTCIGSRLLMFRLDNGGKVLHSQASGDIYDYLMKEIKTRYFLTIPGLTLSLIDSPMFKSLVTGIPIFSTWQKTFGYNDLFDTIFKYGTNGNMRDEKFYFEDSNYDQYIFWIWRGDYLNLGSGAEMGIYHKLIDPSLDFCESANFELPMTLNLYNYYNANNIDNIFCWAPDNKQWWITGFNPDFMDVDVTKMAMIGKVEFTDPYNQEERENMYYSLKEQTQINPETRDFIIFDDNSLTAWVIWWEK